MRKLSLHFAVAVISLVIRVPLSFAKDDCLARLLALRFDTLQRAEELRERMRLYKGEDGYANSAILVAAESYLHARGIQTRRITSMVDTSGERALLILPSKEVTDPKHDLGRFALALQQSLARRDKNFDPEENGQLIFDPKMIVLENRDGAFDGETRNVYINEDTLIRSSARGDPIAIHEASGHFKDYLDFRSGSVRSLQHRVESGGPIAALPGNYQRRFSFSEVSALRKEAQASLADGEPAVAAREAGMSLAFNRVSSDYVQRALAVAHTAKVSRTSDGHPLMKIELPRPDQGIDTLSFATPAIKAGMTWPEIQRAFVDQLQHTQKRLDEERAKAESLIARSATIPKRRTTVMDILYTTTKGLGDAEKNEVLWRVLQMAEGNPLPKASPKVEVQVTSFLEEFTEASKKFSDADWVVFFQLAGFYADLHTALAPNETPPKTTPAFGIMDLRF